MIISGMCLHMGIPYTEIGSSSDIAMHDVFIVCLYTAEIQQIKIILVKLTIPFYSDMHGFGQPSS